MTHRQTMQVGRPYGPPDLRLLLFFRLSPVRVDAATTVYSGKRKKGAIHVTGRRLEIKTNVENCKPGNYALALSRR